MEDKELYNPQTGEKIAPKRPKKFYKDWRFYVYSLIALMLAIVSISSAVTACAAINAGVGQNQDASYSVAQRKNAAISTDGGGFNGYRFEISSLGAPSDDSATRFSVYSMDMSTYTPTLTMTSELITLSDVSLAGVQNVINNYVSVWTPSTADYYNFILFEGSMYFSNGQYREWFYASFLYGTSHTIRVQDFILTNKSIYRAWRLSVDDTALFGQSSNFFMLTSQQTDYIPYSATQGDILVDGASYVFQDVSSFYRELGYQTGYAEGYSEGNSEGYSAGESAGYASGYSEGLEVGNSNGEANGYADGYAAGLNASNYFKSITANNDLVFFDILANITPYYTDGNGNLYYYRIFSAEVGEDFYYCWLCYYSTSNWSSWDVYLVWCDQSSSSGFTLDYLKNNSLGVWVVSKANGAFSSVQSYAVYNPSIQILDNAKVSLVYNVQMMQAYVTLDGGRTYGDVYHDGYNSGYQNGYNYGYELGETAGINAAEPEALTNTLVAVFQQPFNQIYRFFNFNILGLNILGLVTGLVSVFIILKVFRKFLK